MPPHLGDAGLGVFHHHVEGALAHHVVGVGGVALADDGLGVGDGAQRDPSGDLVQHVDGEILEAGLRVEETGRFDPPLQL